MHCDGILWWLAVLGRDNGHSGGPVQHPRVCRLAPAETQSGAACWIVFTKCHDTDVDLETG